MARAAQFVKNLQRFRIVTFDITDTLLRFKKSSGEEYSAAAHQLGIDVDLARLENCFRQEFNRLAVTHPNFGAGVPNMTWQQWWIELVVRIFRCVDEKIPLNQVMQLGEMLLTRYRTRDCWDHMEGNTELLCHMKDIGKTVGVISNSDPSLMKVLEEMEISSKFDFVFTSYELGVAKPNKGIFQAPLTKFNVPPHEALHIGNLYEEDYAGPRNTGWCSLLVCKAEKEKKKAKPSHVYESLPQLHEALQTKDIDW